MKTRTHILSGLLIIAVAGVIGCEFKAQVNSGESKIVDQFNVEVHRQAELAYLAGWNDGFKTASGINSGRLTNKEQAYLEAETDRSNYMAKVQAITNIVTK